MVHTCRELRRTPQVSFAQKGQDLQELIDIMDRLKIPADKRPWLVAGGMLWDVTKILENHVWEKVTNVLFNGINGDFMGIKGDLIG